MGESHIFISHDPSSEAFLRFVVDWLTKFYEDVTYDLQTDSGDAAWDEVLQRIVKANVVVFIASPQSAANRRCLAHLAEANRLHIPVVPVMVAPTELPAAIAGQRVIDLSSELVTQNLSRLYKDIHYHIDQRRQLSNPPPPLSSQPTPRPQ
jgi:hypothetical protein